MTKFVRPNRKMPCRYLLCRKDLTERADTEVHMLDGRNYVEVIKADSVYLCKEHIELLELLAMADYQFWQTREGWLYVVDPSDPLNAPFEGVQDGPGWG